MIICLIFWWIPKLLKNLNGKIILIENADPGFDWIFTKRIKGFVTQYGGSNSHMAIRAAELNIPAVIGCGQKKFEELKASSDIEIDTLNKKIEILRLIKKIWSQVCFG